MKRTTKIAAVVVALGLSLGTAGPALAAGHGKPKHTAKQTTVVKAKHSTVKAKAPKVPAKPSPVAIAQAQVLTHSTVLNWQLDGVVRATRLVGLTDADVAAVTANVAADKATLADLATQTKAATDLTTLAQIRTAVWAAHPGNYAEAVEDLQQAGVLTAQIDALVPQVAADSPEAATLADAAAQVADAVAKAQAVTDTTASADLDAIQSLLDTAAAEAQSVQDAIDAAAAAAATPAA